MAAFHDALLRRLSLINDLGTSATAAAQSKASTRRSYSGGGGESYGNAPSGSSSYKGERGTRSALLEFSKKASKLGYRVAENPYIGNGRVGKHSNGSQHYVGDAVDINWAAGTSAKEQAMLRRLDNLIAQYGLNDIFMAPGHYGHRHVNVPRRR